MSCKTYILVMYKIARQNFNWFLTVVIEIWKFRNHTLNTVTLPSKGKLQYLQFWWNWDITTFCTTLYLLYRVYYIYNFQLSPFPRSGDDFLTQKCKMWLQNKGKLQYLLLFVADTALYICDCHILQFTFDQHQLVVDTAIYHCTRNCFENEASDTTQIFQDFQCHTAFGKKKS